MSIILSTHPTQQSALISPLSPPGSLGLGGESKPSRMQLAKGSRSPTSPSKMAREDVFASKQPRNVEGAEQSSAQLNGCSTQQDEATLSCEAFNDKASTSIQDIDMANPIVGQDISYMDASGSGPSVTGTTVLSKATEKHEPSSAVETTEALAKDTVISGSMPNIDLVFDRRNSEQATWTKSLERSRVRRMCGNRTLQERVQQLRVAAERSSQPRTPVRSPPGQLGQPARTRTRHTSLGDGDIPEQSDTSVQHSADSSLGNGEDCELIAQEDISVQARSSSRNLAARSHIVGSGSTRGIVQSAFSYGRTGTDNQENKAVAEQQLQQPQPAIDSLASIPFIDDPVSPSTDNSSRPISAVDLFSAPPQLRDSRTNPPPAQSVILQSSNEDASLLGPVSMETGSCHDNRHSVRSSYIFGKEGAGGMLPERSPHVPHREGWLHVCQTPVEQMAPTKQLWERMFAVLRGGTLYVYEDAAQTGPPRAALPLQGSPTDVFSSDSRCQHILQISTGGVQYLLQAPDRGELLAWIQAIQQCSDNTVTLSRNVCNDVQWSQYGTRTRSSLGKEAMDEQIPTVEIKPRVVEPERTEPGKDRGPWKGFQQILRQIGGRSPPETRKVFGVRLEECATTSKHKWVPQVVVACCEMIERYGLSSRGIFRVPGRLSAVSAMQEELNRSAGEPDTTDERWQDPNVVSSLLKSFFQKLPDPLFTEAKYKAIIEANQKKHFGTKLKSLKQLIHELPPHHHHTLCFLANHLHTVASNAEVNKMDAHNLAIVFGQTLLRPPSTSLSKLMEHVTDRNVIVEMIIKHAEWFFVESTDLPTPKEPGPQSPFPTADFTESPTGHDGLSESGSEDSFCTDARKVARKKGLSLGAATLPFLTPNRKKPKTTGIFETSVGSFDDDGNGRPLSIALPCDPSSFNHHRGKADGMSNTSSRSSSTSQTGDKPSLQTLPFLEICNVEVDGQTCEMKATAPSRSTFECHIDIFVQPCGEAEPRSDGRGATMRKETPLEPMQADTGVPSTGVQHQPRRAFNAFRVKHRDTLTRKRRSKHGRVQVSLTMAASATTEKPPVGWNGGEEGRQVKDQHIFQEPRESETKDDAGWTPLRHVPTMEALPQESKTWQQPSVCPETQSAAVCASNKLTARREIFRVSRSIKSL
uniref:rho GTPase-activating protein 21-like isoform X2 n=1 Tax=Myxine glutinosa TaxID=7769 RepID=UPI00358F0EE2